MVAVAAVRGYPLGRGEMVAHHLEQANVGGAVCRFGGHEPIVEQANRVGTERFVVAIRAEVSDDVEDRRQVFRWG